MSQSFEYTIAVWVMDGVLYKRLQVTVSFVLTEQIKGPNMYGHTTQHTLFIALLKAYTIAPLNLCESCICIRFCAGKNLSFFCLRPHVSIHALSCNNTMYQIS